MSSNSFVVASLRYNIIMTSSNRDKFISSFPIWICFIFSCLFVVTRTSNTVSNKHDGSEHFCLVLDLKENALNFSLLSTLLALVLSYMTYILHWSVLLLHQLYWDCFGFFFFFLRNGYCTLSIAFYASIMMTIWLLFFNFLMWRITLIDLWILNHPCIPGTNTTLIMVYDTFNMWLPGWCSV